MGLPGTKPKPVELKILQGETRKERLPTNTPKPQPIAPVCPSGLSASARRAWKQLAPHLEKMGLLTQVDGPAFMAVCVHYALMYDAIKAVSKDGLQTVDENGALRKHPLLQIVRDNSASLRMWAAEFGLTPSSRSRLTLPDIDKADDFFGF